MNTTTTARKVAKRRLALPTFPPRHKPYTPKQLADEVYALTGRIYDPCYLADCLAGTRRVPRDLEKREILPKAIANLLKRKAA